MQISRRVLCRPQGGLNDVLTQIERVCRYAEQFDRDIIIDTNFHSTIYIKDHFPRYFVSRQKRLVLDLPTIEFDLNAASIVPHFLASDLLGYDAYYDRELRCVVEKTTRQPISFDFSKDYAESLLVHHAMGGLRHASVAALARLCLHNDISDELIKRLHSIGSNYVAVHIRNTDYKTSYQSLLNRLKDHPDLRSGETLFVATDNIACLEFCRHIFTGINVVSFSKLPDESGRPLHRLSEHDDVYGRNKDAILDLVMLALSRKIFFFEIHENRSSNKYSGFSLLALDLWHSKTTLARLISRPEIYINPIARTPCAYVEFDEEWYLYQYPDARDTVQRGLLKSAWQHYRRHGILEKRLPAKPAVNETWYLQAYPDVVQAIREGRETSAYDHFVNHGYREGRAPSPLSKKP
jgi:hypothetical protein